MRFLLALSLSAAAVLACRPPIILSALIFLSVTLVLIYLELTCCDKDTAQQGVNNQPVLAIIAFPQAMLVIGSTLGRNHQYSLAQAYDEWLWRVYIGFNQGFEYLGPHQLDRIVELKSQLLLVTLAGLITVSFSIYLNFKGAYNAAKDFKILLMAIISAITLLAFMIVSVPYSEQCITRCSQILLHSFPGLNFAYAGNLSLSVLALSIAASRIISMCKRFPT